MNKKVLLSCGSLIVGALPLVSVMACAETESDWTDVDLTTTEGASFYQDLINQAGWKTIAKVQTNLSKNEGPEFILDFQIIGTNLNDLDQTLLIEIGMNSLDLNRGHVSYKLNDDKWVEYVFSDIISNNEAINSLFYNTIHVISEHQDAYEQIFA